MRTAGFISIISFVVFFSGCSSGPEKITVSDPENILESLKNKLKDDYGLYISRDAKISATTDFYNCKLILLGETEPNMDMSIVVTGMSKTNKLLFKSSLTVEISKNLTNADNEKPCVTQNENMTIEGNSMPRVIETYCKGVDYKTIITKCINSQEKSSVFLMRKSDSKIFADKLFEISM